MSVKLSEIKIMGETVEIIYPVEFYSLEFHVTISGGFIEDFC